MDENASLEAYLYYRHDRQPEAAPRVRRRVLQARPAMMLRQLRKIACRALGHRRPTRDV